MQQLYNIVKRAVSGSIKAVLISHNKSSFPQSRQILHHVI